ncbi:hypothetical protein HPT29_026085 (plasmid) [Microvirga terrae]|uniref:Uncharacterized protein n=1 Tax=Microvirga terrae TaxID=2740529 RepID=A0ABY5RXZ2_9HYPH|nr:hypothetical protein [Microvirga terrae]UVF22170.1 hypothetical protein HPT29_026085 [Microvirga terrae]
MRAFLVSVAAALTLGIAAAGCLTEMQAFTYQAFTASAARLSDPGENLVGADWSGLNKGSHSDE